MQSIYYTAEESATKRGYVGLVIDAQTHKTLSRTPNAYASIAWAMLAAERMWQARPAKLHAAQGAAA
jgi:hypothetical protein